MQFRTDGIFFTFIRNANCRRGASSQDLRFIVGTELETDGRWIAEILQVPGALANGANQAYAIALCSVADDVEHSRREPPHSISLEGIRMIRWSRAKARIVYNARLKIGCAIEDRALLGDF